MFPFLDSFFHLTRLQWEGLYGRRTSLILFSRWLWCFLTLRLSVPLVLAGWTRCKSCFPQPNAFPAVYTYVLLTRYGPCGIPTKVPLLQIEEGSLMSIAFCPQWCSRYRQPPRDQVFCLHFHLFLITHTMGYVKRSLIFSRDGKKTRSRFFLIE